MAWDWLSFAVGVLVTVVVNIILGLRTYRKVSLTEHKIRFLEDTCSDLEQRIIIANTRLQRALEEEAEEVKRLEELRKRLGGDKS